MKNSNMPAFELWFLIIGEIVVSALVSAIYFIIGLFGEYTFSYNVITGSLLGTLIISLNFVFLVISTNRIFDKARAERGEGEMNDEEVDAFVKEHQKRYDGMIKISFIVRNFTMLAALVLAFILPSVFDVIATLVPLVMYRPIISLAAIVKNKLGKDGT